MKKIFVILIALFGMLSIHLDLAAQNKKAAAKVVEQKYHAVYEKLNKNNTYEYRDHQHAYVIKFHKGGSFEYSKQDIATREAISYKGDWSIRTKTFWIVCTLDGGSREIVYRVDGNNLTLLSDSKYVNDTSHHKEIIFKPIN